MGVKPALKNFNMGVKPALKNEPQLHNAPLEHCYACLGTADRRAAQRKTHKCVAQLARDQRSRFTSRHALEVGRAAFRIRFRQQSIHLREKNIVGPTERSAMRMHC